MELMRYDYKCYETINDMQSNDKFRKSNDYSYYSITIMMMVNIIFRKSELLAEIRRVYSKYIADVKDINENVLKSESFIRTAELYDKFLEKAYEK